MISYNSNLVRAGAGLLCGLMLTVSFGAGTARAALPTTETNPALLAGIATMAGASTVSAANETTQTLIMQVLNGLAWTVAKTAIQSLTQSMVNWINSGFQGSPAFVTDLKENLGNLADAVAEDFITTLDTVVYDNTGFSVRSPFQDQIAAALREEFYRTSSSYGFDARNPYTLGSNCANPTGHSSGDFSCGYDGWFSMSQNPANNPIGRYMIARNELHRRIDSEAQRRISELTWGRGFLSWRGNCGPNSKQAAQGTVPLSQNDTSTKCRIRTPGAIIEESLGITVNSPLRQLEIADSINEIVGALAGQLVTQVLGGAGLSGVSQPASGGGRSFLDRASDPAAYNQAAVGSASAIVQELERAEARGAQVRTSNRAVITRLDQAIRQCALKRDVVTELQGIKREREGAERTYATFLPTIPALRTRIASAQQNTASTPADITRLVDEYQRLISHPAYPRDLRAVEVDRGIIATID
ncbi:MAG TPA: hypothetical protein VF696_00445, partial [Candidatus Paceibacterota bacterium]